MSLNRSTVAQVSAATPAKCSEPVQRRSCQSEDEEVESNRGHPVEGDETRPTVGRQDMFRSSDEQHLQAAGDDVICNDFSGVKQLIVAHVGPDAPSLPLCF